MTGKPVFGDRIAAKTGATAAGEPARQAKYVSPILCQLLLQAQQAFFIPGLHQFMNQGSGREEADGEPLLAGRQTETEGDMGLAGLINGLLR